MAVQFKTFGGISSELGLLYGLGSYCCFLHRARPGGMEQNNSRLLVMVMGVLHLIFQSSVTERKSVYDLHSKMRLKVITKVTKLQWFYCTTVCILTPKNTPHGLVARKTKLLRHSLGQARPVSYPISRLKVDTKCGRDNWRNKTGKRVGWAERRG